MKFLATFFKIIGNFLILLYFSKIVINNDGNNTTEVKFVCQLTIKIYFKELLAL